MAWIYIVIAGLFEVAWAVGLKYSQGFTKPGPTVFTLIGMTVSFAFLAQGVRTIPVGAAYAVWTGIGAVGTAIYGIVKLGEPMTATRIICLAMVIAGIVGLKFLSPE